MSAEAKRIVVLDAATYGDVSLAPLEIWDCQIHPVTAPADVCDRLAGRSVAVTNKVVLDETVLRSSQARDLRLIAVAATGTDIIDRATAKSLGIQVCNVPGYATDSVAQFTIALVLELATAAGRYAAAVRSNQWQQSPVFTLLKYPSIELRGKTLGIVGYGSIGRTVAAMAQSLGMRVVVAARAGASGRIPAGRMPLPELLREADFVTLHCPLTPETRNLINRQTLQMMKASAFLINTARGALIDETALIDALRDKRLAGAALDVISNEPPPINHPIIEAAKTLGTLMITPHTAWSAREARERLISEVAENISAFFAGRARNLVA